MALGNDLFLVAQTGIYSTTGPSVSLANGVAYVGHQTFANAGAVDGDDYYCTIRDASGNSLVWKATYSAADAKLTRVLELESIGTIYNSASVHVFSWGRASVPTIAGLAMLEAANAAAQRDLLEISYLGEDGDGNLIVGGSLNHTKFSSDGTLSLVGAATAWDDMLVEMKESVKGSNLKPDWDATNFGLLFPQNDTTEYVVFNMQMPHKWKEGSTVFPHVHFHQASNQIPVFKIDYRWTNIGDAVSGSWATYTMDSLVSAYSSGTIHQIAKGSAGISGAGKTFSSMLQVKLYRQDNVYSGDCLVTSFDLHIEIDSFGTSSEYAK